MIRLSGSGDVKYKEHTFTWPGSGGAHVITHNFNIPINTVLNVKLRVDTATQFKGVGALLDDYAYSWASGIFQCEFGTGLLLIDSNSFLLSPRHVGATESAGGLVTACILYK